MTDLTLAREQQNAFEEYLADNPSQHPGIELTVTVLTTGFWPTYKSSDMALPAEMVGNFNGFLVFLGCFHGVLLGGEILFFSLGFCSNCIFWTSETYRNA